MATRPGTAGVRGWDTDERRSRSKSYVGVCVIAGLMSSASWARQEPAARTDSGSTATSQIVIIPDGTPVQLRFAQPVRGKIRGLNNVAPQAKANETVRLVSATDVRVNEFVVIAKGAIGEATITKVWHPFIALTGLGLRLDWIEDVTGKRLPLRIAAQGKPQPFTVQVLSTTGGMVARPETLRGDLIGSDAVDASIIWRKKNWIPAGTRILAFIHGAAVRDFADLKDAQVLGSISSDAATLTVYRTKSVGESHPRVVCDGKVIGTIGARRYVTLSLTTGKHVCQPEHEKSLEISAHAGEEYYVQLKSTVTGWELKPVSTPEGEDAVATSEPAGK